MQKRHIAAALVGIVLMFYGVAALISISHGADEFRYQIPAGGSALWPLPFAPLNGFTPEQLSSHVARAVLLFPACMLLGWALAAFAPRSRFNIAPTLIVLTGASLTAAIALFVIRGVPLQDDDATYVMQAELLTRGLIADPTYSPSVAFAEPFTIFVRRGMSGMYLFGTPLVLALGLPLGAPWAGQVGLVVLTLWCASRAAIATDRWVATVGTSLLAVSPMLTFTSATSLSQPAGLAGIALAVLGLQIAGWRGGALIGTGLGLAFAARPQMAAPAGIALAIVYGWKDRRAMAGALLAGLPWIVAVALYDHALTGNAWTLPRFAYAGELEKYGFGTGMRGYTHTPLTATALAGVVMVRLNGWALGWPMSLAGPALWFAIGLPYRQIVGPWAAVALAAFLYQAGYPSIGTSETGAIYHYAALPFFSFATAAALREAESRRFGDWVRATAIVSLLVGTTSFYLEHALRLSRLTAAIEGPRRSLDLEPPALVFEEAWEGRPQVGWVFGIPFRERSPSALIVRFPRPANAAEFDGLLRRFPERHCSYLWYEWRASAYRLSPCSEMAAIARSADSRAR